MGLGAAVIYFIHLLFIHLFILGLFSTALSIACSVDKIIGSPNSELEKMWKEMEVAYLNTPSR
jgi:hypothetical protein